ncbi:hypothetical protein KGO5_02429 [Sinorhizobium sp. KGO-5]|nr:hypothetical protein KGO5_02429 [Sinorhizobium sp. KGO-5]
MEGGVPEAGAPRSGSRGDRVVLGSTADRKQALGEGLSSQGIDAKPAQATEAADSCNCCFKLLGFVSLVIGAVAAWFGGASGTTRTVVPTNTTRRVS